MSLYKMFETDKRREEEGTWLRYGEAKIKVLRAGMSNKRFKSRVSKFMRSHQRHLNSLDDEQVMPELIDIYADTVIIDWEGVRDREMNLLPFTKENLVKLLTDLPELFVDIRDRTFDREEFKAQEDDETAKN